MGRLTPAYRLTTTQIEVNPTRDKIDMQDNLVSDGAKDLEQPVHDQLPSPAEVNHRSSRRLDETKLFDTMVAPPMNFGQNDEAYQLPSVEDLKTSSRSSGMNQPEQSNPSRRKLIWVGSICVVLLVVAVVGVAVGLSQNRQDDSSSTSAGNEAEGTHGSRLETIVGFLVGEGISESTALKTPGSPQQLGANFVANSDPVTYPVPESISSSYAHRFIQRYVLTVFFYALNGDQWRNHLHFASNTNECLWYAVAYSSDGGIYRLGVECNDASQVIALRVSGNNLEGGIPEEIGFLSELQVLSLHFNRISRIPESMRQLRSLQWLAVHYNQLEGPIPDWLSELSSLHTLVLSNNDFSGPIPPSFATLTDMDTLGLDDNKLTGDLSVISAMTNMRRLYLEDNQFTGTIDDEFLVEMPGLEELDLSDNLFQGTVPPHLLQLEKLRALDLHDNELDGSLPKNIPVNNALTVLALHGNNITDSIPESIQNLQGLARLDLSSNRFKGDIVPALANMTALTYLFLADNDFEASPIPDFLQNLVKLEELSLKSTQRTGPIPDWMEIFSGLVLLDLDDNGLSGSVNSKLGDLSKLRFLLLNRNQLDGTLPEELQDLSNLDMLLLQDNRLTGTTSKLGCDSLFNISVFVTDCNVTCECCSLCCGDIEDCEDKKFLVPANNDPIWERDYNREFFAFGQETTFDEEGLVPP